jgi:hypothetical protein
MFSSFREKVSLSSKVMSPAPSTWMVEIGHARLPLRSQAQRYRVARAARCPERHRRESGRAAISPARPPRIGWRMDRVEDDGQSEAGAAKSDASERAREREARLAAALRANLRRRKAVERSRPPER